MGRTVTPSIPATTSIVNYFSSGGSSTITANSPLRKTVLSGAATAGQLVTALSVGGSGWCSLLYAYNNSGGLTTHTIRLQVQVDGATVFDATSDSIATTPNRRSVIAVGSVEGTSFVWDGTPIRFNGALVVNIASSQAGTDLVGLAYEYNLA